MAKHLKYTVETVRFKKARPNYILSIRDTLNIKTQIAWK